MYLTIFQGYCKLFFEGLDYISIYYSQCLAFWWQCERRITHLVSIRVEFEMPVAKDSHTLLSYQPTYHCSTVPCQLLACSLLSLLVVAACGERLLIILYWNDLVSSLAAPSLTWLYFEVLLKHMVEFISFLYGFDMWIRETWKGNAFSDQHHIQGEEGGQGGHESEEFSEENSQHSSKIFPHLQTLPSLKLGPARLDGFW